MKIGCDAETNCGLSDHVVRPSVTKFRWGPIVRARKKPFANAQCKCHDCTKHGSYLARENNNMSISLQSVGSYFLRRTVPCTVRFSRLMRCYSKLLATHKAMQCTCPHTYAPTQIGNAQSSHALLIPNDFPVSCECGS